MFGFGGGMDFDAMMRQAMQQSQGHINNRMKQSKVNKRAAKKTTNMRGNSTDPAYDSKAENTIKADVRMFSGCKDKQTSADVSNVASFGLPPVSSAEKAGGACTNALLMSLQENDNRTVGDLCIAMQGTLKKRGYTQVPQLCSSHQIKLREEKFSLWNDQGRGRHKSLLIGINYYGQKGELAGCVNDVRMMQRFLETQGFRGDEQHMRILTDDPNGYGQHPTTGNITAGMDWLVEGAQPGDTLFLHYSGHGGSIPDDDGDEADGKDEALIPSDYKSSGMIRDDDVFGLLVAPLPKGVKLFCVFDCCHSGTIMDLPYMFTTDNVGVQAIQSGQANGMEANPGFNFDFTIQKITQVAQGFFKNSPGIAKMLGMATTGGGSGGQRAAGGRGQQVQIQQLAAQGMSMLGGFGGGGGSPFGGFRF